MTKLFPPKLKVGDEVRVVAPSRSLAMINSELRQVAQERFHDLGLRLTFSAHAEENDIFKSSSIESRVADLHEAFADPEVKAIITVIGGFNANQLLDFLDWELIKSHPKIFCGYSDITILNNALLAKTGLVSYSGPHYSTFGQKLYFDYTLNFFKKCLITDQPFEIEPSQEWSDDEWYLNQQDRHLMPNEGFWILNEGQAEGTIVGGNLGTFTLLQGTQYQPSLKDSILFIEDDLESLPHHFDRTLQSLIHQPEFSLVRALVIGRFQKASQMSFETLQKIIQTKPALAELPIIANVDFGHTDPKITFPIGGTAAVSAEDNKASLRIVKA
jgi:muramoyltetrapeptide carboxypeptidase